jgi:hypothetical protein
VPQGTADSNTGTDGDTNPDTDSTPNLRAGHVPKSVPATGVHLVRKKY